MLSNQLNLTKHIMSLDEVEISERTGNDLLWNNVKSPQNNAQKNNKVNSNNQAYMLNQVSVQDRSENDSFQMMGGFQPPSTAQN